MTQPEPSSKKTTADAVEILSHHFLTRIKLTYSEFKKKLLDAFCEEGYGTYEVTWNVEGAVFGIPKDVVAEFMRVGEEWEKTKGLKAEMPEPHISLAQCSLLKEPDD